MHFLLCPDGRRLFCSWLSQLVQRFLPCLFKVTLNEGFTGVLLKKNAFESWSMWKKQLNRRILLCSVELRGRVHLLGTRSSCTPVIKEATTRTFSRLTCVFKNEELCVHTFYALVFYFIFVVVECVWRACVQTWLLHSVPGLVIWAGTHGVLLICPLKIKKRKNNPHVGVFVKRLFCVQTEEDFIF